MPELTAREILEQEWDKHEQEESAPTEPKAGGSDQDTQEPVRTATTETPGKVDSDTGDAASRTDGRDEKGQFAAKKAVPAADGEGHTEVPPAKAAEQPAAGTAPPVAGAQPAPDQSVQPVADKAPVTWSPQAREEWAKLPPTVREQVAKRERETAQVISQSAEARKVANDFQQVVSPFQDLIRAQNSTPMQAVQNLMRTSAALTIGTPEQKARVVREIIQNFGVDVEVLDAVLANLPLPQGGGQGGGGAIPGHVQQYVQQAMQPVNQLMTRMQQAEQERQQRIEQESASAMEKFANDPKNEFFEDVRMDMADMLEVAARRGVVMSMDDAYARTCALRPEIKAVLDQRAAAVAATGGQQAVANARQAAASIKGAPAAGTGPKGAPLDRRAAIAEAWDAASR